MLFLLLSSLLTLLYIWGRERRPDLTDSVKRTNQRFVFANALDGKAVEDDAQRRECGDEFEVEGGGDVASPFCNKLLQIQLIVIDEYSISCHIAHQKDGAEDGEPQLSHALAEEYDAHA